MNLGVSYYHDNRISKTIDRCLLKSDSRKYREPFVQKYSYSDSGDVTNILCYSTDKTSLHGYFCYRYSYSGTTLRKREVYRSITDFNFIDYYLSWDKSILLAVIYSEAKGASGALHLRFTTDGHIKSWTIDSFISNEKKEYLVYSK